MRILHWDFGNTDSYDGSSTVQDLEGNSDGTVVGSPETTSSNCGTHLKFNGSGQYVVSDSDLTSNFGGVAPTKSTLTSIVMWVYPTGNGVILAELGQAEINDGWHEAQIEMVSGTMKFGAWSSSGLQNFASSVPTPLNQWHHVALVYDGSELKAYVNEQPAGSSNFYRAAPYNAGHGLHYAIAAEDSTNMGDGSYGNAWAGSLEVFNEALTQTQVSENYSASRGNYICGNRWTGTRRRGGHFSLTRGIIGRLWPDFFRHSRHRG